jgi:hypothetical protein
MLLAEPVSAGLCLITINAWEINLEQEEDVFEVIPPLCKKVGMG